MLVGISLGVLGSGGSILTVPIMVYLFGVNAVDATGYSLFVVGMASLIGAIKYLNRKLVTIKTAIIFAIPSIVSVFLTRKFLMPAIPNPVFSWAQFVVSKEKFVLLLFALLMIVVAINMLKQKASKEDDVEKSSANFTLLILVGFVSGMLTGLVGVGGGFIIIPALVFFAKTPLKTSVGTSLIVIAANSFIGFSAEVLERSHAIDWKFLFTFSAFSIAGIYIGFAVANKISPFQLKKMFGWFVLITGIVIFIKEVF
jgi:uncharacterized membrane protein YfcA